MRRALWIVLGLTVLTGVVSSQTGWIRYRVETRTPEEVQRLSDSELGLFSDDVALGETDMIVGPGQWPELLELGLPYRWISNLPNATAWADRVGPLADDYQHAYLRYSAIIAQYETWRLANPNWVSREVIGFTWNNRPIYAYRLFAQMPGGARRPARSILINNGIHAREWISPAVGMYLFERLIQSYKTRDAFSYRIAPGTAFYFIPVLNADGYEFCWTDDRYWRKNRRSHGGGEYGVDLNRNFSKGWGGQGSSGNKGSETYRGPSAFSEPESAAVRDFADRIPPVKGFIDFHSYGQYILWPWGYQTSLSPGDAWLSATGVVMKNAIFDTWGKVYTAGPSASTLYVAAGITPDYMYDRFNAAAYTIELRDTGQTGFVLPENQIQPTQIEAWAAFQELSIRMLLR